MSGGFGPLGPRAVTSRPAADPDTYSNARTWFKNCSAPGAADGTVPTASFFNHLIANLNFAADEAGVVVDNDQAEDGYLWEIMQAAAAAGAATLYSEAPTPPSIPRPGQRWKNTSLLVVSGISAGAVARWTGAVWAQETFGGVTVPLGSQSLANNSTTILALGSPIKYGQTDVAGANPTAILLNAGTYAFGLSVGMNCVLNAMSTTWDWTNIGCEVKVGASSVIRGFVDFGRPNGAGGPSFVACNATPTWFTVPDAAAITATVYVSDHDFGSMTVAIGDYSKLYIHRLN